jgi:hypothetical protein
MPTFYCVPRGSVAAGGNGQSLATAFNGFEDLQTRGLALTANGDTIVFVGTFTITDYTYNTNASFSEVQGIPSSWYVGPMLGNNSVSTSSASGRTFDFRQAVVDMRGATTNTQRMSAGLIIRGERINVWGGTFIAPNWNYLFNDATGATRVPWNAGMGSGDATLTEQASWENGGLLVAGCGNTVDDITIFGAPTRGLGGSGWCRHGLMMHISNSGMGSATAGLTNTIKNSAVSGALTAFSCTAFGVGGSTIMARTVVQVFNNRAFDPVWGWPSGRTRDEYNAGAHGNGIEFSPQGKGLVDAYRNVITGNFQDALDFGGASECRGWNNTIIDIGDPFIQHWQWDSTGAITGTANTWWLKYRANGEGNGIKMGLAAEGTGSIAPTTWLGSDGTVGSDNLMVKEHGNRVWGNTILRTNSSGITLNSARGSFIHANEIIDTRGMGINLFNTTAGNNCVTNNYVKLASNATNGYGALYWGNLQRGIVVNNILDAGANSTCFDLMYVSGAAVLTKTRNVYVTNRISGTPPADTVAITSPGSLAWSQGQGLVAGHAYYTSGDPNIALISKAARGGHDMRGNPLGAALGPFAAAVIRAARA